MHTIRIGTRDSELALWQANQVSMLLQQEGFETILVPIKSEGDLDLKTPLYEIGVEGIFTRSLDIALINNRIDIAVHSMKDVPIKPATGIIQAAVLQRGSPFDLLVFKVDGSFLNKGCCTAHIATSSIRRKAQWLHRYPEHQIHNLRGNVNTRLEKLELSNWDAAIFAKAGLERINKIPKKSLVIDWMLPAPAQGAIMVVCREDDANVINACAPLNDEKTELCTKIERDFLRELLGGCSTPISAYAEIKGQIIHFKGNVLSPDGQRIAEIKKEMLYRQASEVGIQAAEELLAAGGKEIVHLIQEVAKSD